MPTITLPAQGDKPWDGILNTAITDINDAVDENTEALGALPDTFVTSVNSATGAVTVTPAGIGAAATSHTHAASALVSGTLDDARIPTLAISKTSGLQGELDSKLESVALSDIEATGTPSGTTYLRGDGSWSTPEGGGAVDSVNGETGTVVLDAADVGALASDVTLDDIPAGSTNVQFTSTMSSKLAGIASGAQVNTVASVAGKTGAVSLVKGDVGLGSVDNTSDASKPVSTATQTALDAKEYVLTAGANITINRTNPLAPIISASGGSGGAGDWGSIGGDLSDQADLVAALDAKQDTITDSDDITQGTTNLFLTGAERTKLTGVQVGAEVNTVDSVNGAVGAVVLDADDIADGTTNKAYTATEKTKLSGIATGATANQSDATTNAAIALKANAANPVFTGTVTVPDGALAIADTSGLQSALDAKADESALGTASAEDVGFFATAAQGALADSAVQPIELSDYVATTRTVNGQALNTDIVLDAADVGARPDTYVPAWSEVTGKPTTFAPVIGSGAGDAVAGNDARLTDTRTPTDNSVTSAKIVDGAIVNADINAAAAIAQSKISGLTTDLAAKAPLTNRPELRSFATEAAATAAMPMAAGTWVAILVP